MNTPLRTARHLLGSPRAATLALSLVIQGWVALSWVVLLGLTLSAPPRAHGQDAEPRPAPAEDPGKLTREVLQRLNDPRFAVREQATMELLSDDRLTSSDLAMPCRLARTPEQRHRLLLVARHHLLREAQGVDFDGPQRSGALGMFSGGRAAISLQIPKHPDDAHAGVQVLRTYLGFPAFAKFKPGDLIVGVRSPRAEELPGPTDPTGRYKTFAPDSAPEQVSKRFSDLMEKSRAGDEVSFLVYRDHRALSAPVVLRLASHDALNNMYERTSRELQPRYRALWRSYRDDLDRLQVPPATLNAPWPGRSEGVAGAGE